MNKEYLFVVGRDGLMCLETEKGKIIGEELALKSVIEEMDTEECMNLYQTLYLIGGQLEKTIDGMVQAIVD